MIVAAAGTTPRPSSRRLVLHVLNGDATARTFRDAGLPGDTLTWREMLAEGPASNVVGAAALTQLRARWLEETLGVARGIYLQQLLEQELALERCADHDEVVLWFEADLFCQVNLIYLLDWLDRQPRQAVRISLVYPPPDGPEAPPRPLAEMAPAAFANLFAERRTLTRQDLNLGRAAWDAYSASDPQRILGLLRETSEPLVVDAFTRHLRRFPSLETGVNEVEQETLVAVAEGVRDLPALFARVRRNWRIARHGMGDLQFWAVLDRMRRGAHPLLEIDGPDELPKYGAEPTPEILLRWSIELTETGREILAGRGDWVEMNGTDRWLGGVNLRGRDRVWRWDEARQALVRR